MKLKRENWTERLVLDARHRSMTTLNSINAGTDHITQERLILSCITSSTSARNIGVWLDNLVSMDEQIASISKSAFFHLQNIANIRKFISFQHCETLIHAVIT